MIPLHRDPHFTLIDTSLHVVGRLLVREVAEKAAWQMAHPWQH
jgi:hypothetical protein